MAKIKFHLDEQVERSIGEGLRRRKIDVTTTPEAELLGASDEKQLAFAMVQQRVIFTQHDDFLAIHQQGVEHCGIVYGVSLDCEVHKLLYGFPSARE